MTPARRLLVAAVLGALTVAACGGGGGSAAPSSRSTSPPSLAATGPNATAAHAAPPTTRGGDRPIQGADWVTYDRDPGRSGVDGTSPPVGAVAPAWTSPVLDGKVYAQPLVVGSSVVVATEDDTVYALDAATGTPRWVRHLAAPVSGSSLPCGNIDPSGITGTPVADVATGALWVVTFSPPARHTLWSLSLATGAVTSSRSADPAGADPRAEQQRGALALDGSRVYIPYGGLFGDCSDYHGWIVGFSATSTAGVGTTPVTWETRDAQSGIWAPPGPVVARDGSILVATGNGRPYDLVGESDSVIRLSPTLTVNDSFTPANYRQLSAGDLDLGSTSPALVGGLVFEAGKQGIGYLMAASHLGGLGGEQASARVCGGGFGGTAVDGDLVFISCFNGLYALRVTSPATASAPRLTVIWSAPGAHPGPPIVAGGAVWTVESYGELMAVSETTGTVQYERPIGVAGSFPSPAAAGGWLFAPDDDRVEAFRGV